MFTSSDCAVRLRGCVLHRYGVGRGLPAGRPRKRWDDMTELWVAGGLAIGFILGRRFGLGRESVPAASPESPSRATIRLLDTLEDGIVAVKADGRSPGQHGWAGHAGCPGMSQAEPSLTIVATVGTGKNRTR